MAPPSTDLLDIDTYFTRYGWSYEQLDDETWRTAVRTRTAAFIVIVRLTDHWVMFTINPYIEPPPGGFQEASLRALAMANHAVHMAKLGIDAEGDAFVTIELPQEGFTYSQFADALTTLTHVADQFLVPLLQARVVDGWREDAREG